MSDCTANNQDLRTVREFVVQITKFLWLRRTNQPRWVLPATVVEKLGVGMRGKRVAEHADGRKEAVDVTGPIIVELLSGNMFETTGIYSGNHSLL